MGELIWIDHWKHAVYTFKHGTFRGLPKVMGGIKKIPNEEWFKETSKKSIITARKE